MDLKSAKVPSNSSLDIPIYFHPLTLGPHSVNCLLLVDSRKYPIKITGEAVKINVQLCHAQDRYIDLGKMQVGTVTKRVVELINRTQTSFSIFVNLKENLPSSKKPLEIVKPEIKIPDVIVSEM